MMELTRILPKTVPTTFGTPEIAKLAVAAGHRRARPLVPPVDVASNAPDAVEGDGFRDALGLAPGDVLVATVSRLAAHMKSESLHRTIEVVGRLGAHTPISFAVVGEGQARAKLERRAAEINASLGRRAIVFNGALLDPRPAYAAADIVVGMGGSALRGMAFGKPVIVVGDNGFCDIFDPSTAVDFFFRGIYGHGAGDPDNDRLTSLLSGLTRCAGRRAELGAFGRQWVVDRFSLEAVSAKLAECYRDAIENPPSVADRTFDTLRMATIYLRERRFLTPSRDRRPIEAVADNLDAAGTQGRPA